MAILLLLTTIAAAVVVIPTIFYPFRSLYTHFRFKLPPGPRPLPIKTASDKKIKIGINGFGRISRLVARVALQRNDNKV